MIIHTERLLSLSGSAAFILPFQAEIELLALAEDAGLYPEKIMRVKGNLKSEIKRTMVQLSRNQNNPIFENLTIERERKIYTPEYIELTKDFYLDFK